MAFCCLRPNLKSSCAFLRPLRYFLNIQKCLQFSTSEKLTTQKSTPVTYTTSKGAEIPIRETIFVGSSEKKNTLKHEKLIITVSLAVFFIYFCVIREENDIDEILKGNPEYLKNSTAELLQLKFKLMYCERNNLPTEGIKAQIANIEMENNLKSSFPK